MAITCIARKSLCFPNLFFICLFMFSTAILQCNTERRLEVQDQFAVNSIDGCLEEGNEITDDPNTNLVSPGNEFECGFFSPENNTKNGRYLGIWYHKQNPKTVVWVANRDKPLLGYNGYLILKDRTAMLLDKKNVTYWSTSGVSHMRRSNISFGTGRLTNKNNITYPRNTARSLSIRKLCLLDTGNLVLNDRRLREESQILWQSFEHPTDTLLPGMTVNLILSSTTLSLTSWKNHSDTSRGNYNFMLHPNNDNFAKFFITDIAQKGDANYWQSEATPFDKLPSALFLLRLNNSPFPNNTRLVMNFTGQLQFWTLENGAGWSLNWSEPKDVCSLSDDRCGNFASCNSNNGRPCKCLPGFKPYSEGTSRGCSRKSELVCERKDSLSDMFLKLPKMKLGNSTCTATSSTDEKCRAQCLSNCHCVAYSTDSADCSLARSSKKGCLIWKDELTNLQEDFFRWNHYLCSCETF